MSAKPKKQQPGPAPKTARKQPQATVLPAEKTRNTERQLTWLLALIGGFLFVNTLTHGFVLDDIAVIGQNKFVQQGFAGIPKLFTTFYWQGYWDSNAGLYRPLSMVMFAIEWAISPNNPFIHHLVNVVLYALTIGVLFRLLRRLFAGYPVWIAFGITLLFAVHPTHTEVVANIKSRDEILCFLFFLLTFGYILRTGLATMKHKLIAGGLFLLCLLSKEAGILFLPIMGLYFLLFKKEGLAAEIKRFLPLAIVAGLWLALHQYVIQSSPFERITYTYLDNSVVACDGARVPTGIAIFGRYLLKAVAPFNLSYDYSYSEIPCESFGSPIVLLTLLVLAGMLFAAWHFRTKLPAVTFGILFFLISIVLVTNVFTLIGATMGDRLLYAPVLGICIAFVFGVSALAKKLESISWRQPAFWSFVLLAFAGSIYSFRRNKDWESNTTLFTADLQNAPNSARVHYNYATVLMEQLPEDPARQGEELPQVIAEFEKALAIDPKDNGSHVNLAVCYYRKGEYDKSAQHSREALKQAPNDYAVMTNLADAYYKANRSDSAVFYYNKIIAAGQASANSYNFLGALWFNRQNYPEAIKAFGAGVEKYPTNEELLVNLGSAYGVSGQYGKSMEILRKALNINPANKEALRLMALAYQNTGDQANFDKYMGLYSKQP